MLSCKWDRLSSVAIISFPDVLSFPEMVSIQRSDHLLSLHKLLSDHAVHCFVKSSGNPSTTFSESDISQTVGKPSEYGSV